MRIFNKVIASLAVVALLATSTVSRKSEAHPVAIAMGVALGIIMYKMATQPPSNLPPKFEENLARNISAMERCQKSSDLAQISLYTKMWDFLHNDFYARVYHDLTKGDNEAGAQLVAQLEDLRANDPNSFDWNLLNLAVASSNIVIEKMRSYEGWIQNHFYTAFTYLKFSPEKRAARLAVNECGLKNVITETPQDLVNITQPAFLDDDVVAQSAPFLRQVMKPYVQKVEDEHNAENL